MIWTWNVLGLHNFVQAAYEPIMVLPMHGKKKKQMFSSYHFVMFITY